MKQKKIIPFTLFLLLAGGNKLLAQQGLVASGGDATGAGGSASYSVGQVDFITKQGLTGKSTEGLQQPFEIYTNSIIDVNNRMAAFVYPNPTTNYVTLSVTDVQMGQMSYSLYDLQGRLLVEQKLSSDLTTISLADLPNATYFLKVTMNNSEIRTFKIIKN